MKRFAVFIMSHGRARTLSTYDSFRKRGYTGDMYVVIDNEDDQEDLYRWRFGDAVVQFDKRDYLCKTDLGDLDENRRVGVFARNFIQDKAKEMGYKYHLQMDDDMYGVSWRYVDEKGKLRSKRIFNLDAVFEAMCDYMDEAPLTSLSFGLAMFYAGGVNGNSWKRQMIHKAMGTYLMRADDISYFNMRMNDDITTVALNTTRGKLHYTFMPLHVETDETQKQSGGMTEAYQENGTYMKSFYTVMNLPSCSKIRQMGVTDMRIHHEVLWNYCAPKLLSEEYRKW